MTERDITSTKAAVQQQREVTQLSRFLASQAALEREVLRSGFVHSPFLGYSGWLSKKAQLAPAPTELPVREACQVLIGNSAQSEQ